MVEERAVSDARHASIRSHRCLHSLFTPTHLVLGSDPNSKTDEVNVVWQSRCSRKARYSSVSHVIEEHPSTRRTSNGPHTSEDASELKRLAVDLRVQTETHLKPHLILDVTFWLAVAFTFGSAIWVVNGFLVWFPILIPKLDTDAFTNTAAASAFLGGTVFEVGSYLMVLEALKHGRETSAGTTLGHMIHRPRQSGVQNRTSTEGATFNGSPDVETRGYEGDTELVERTRSGAWVWWGKPLWHDIGYVAAVVQLVAATIFWISTLTGLPGIIKGLYGGDGSEPIIDVFFWSPQVVGGIGFILSSTLLMLETQHNWYQPNLTDLGWYIGAWNLVGSVGFTLCGALGYAANGSDGAAYQSGLSTWWGGWAFLFGSVLQLGEAIWREKPHVS